MPNLQSAVGAMGRVQMVDLNVQGRKQVRLVGGHEAKCGWEGTRIGETKHSSFYASLALVTVSGKSCAAT